jgi:hypothetical protein
LAKAGLPIGDPAHALKITKLQSLLRAYAKTWVDYDKRFRILAVELMVLAPLWNPETHHVSRTYTLAGKLDLCIEDEQGRYAIIDHKTCGEDIEDADAPYFKAKIVEGQFLHYDTLERLNDRRIDHLTLNVARKTATAPRQITRRSDLDEIANYRTYFGEPISAEAAVYAYELKRENLELYGARLYHDAAIEKPKWYFARRNITHVDKLDLDEYMRDLWQDAVAMREERLLPRHTPTSKACMAYNTPCQFLGICSGYDKPESDRWEPVKNVHEELVGLPGESRAYITNSRLQMFKLCKRKHHFLYEMGIRRQEPSEALDYGILWHECLAEYYLTMQQQQQQEAEQSASEERKEQHEPEPAAAN